jgi:hypothetical protein
MKFNIGRLVKRTSFKMLVVGLVVALTLALGILAFHRAQEGFAVNYPPYDNTKVYRVGDGMLWVDPATGVATQYQMAVAIGAAGYTPTHPYAVQNRNWTVAPPPYLPYDNAKTYQVGDIMTWTDPSTSITTNYQMAIPIGAAGYTPTHPYAVQNKNWTALPPPPYPIYDNAKTYRVGDIMTWINPATNTAMNYRMAVAIGAAGYNPAHPYAVQNKNWVPVPASPFPLYDNNKTYKVGEGMRWTDPASGIELKYQMVVGIGAAGYNPTHPYVIQNKNWAVIPPPYPGYDNAKTYKVGDMITWIEPTSGRAGTYRMAVAIGAAGYAPNHPYAVQNKNWILVQ